MPWTLLGFLLSTALYFSLVVWHSRGGRLEKSTGRDLGTSMVVMIGTMAVFFTRSAITGTSFSGALRGATLINFVLVIVTRGNPALIFDADISEAERDAMTDQDRAAHDRRETLSARAQVIFLGLIIAGVVAYSLSGAGFLD